MFVRLFSNRRTAIFKLPFRDSSADMLAGMNHSSILATSRFDESFLDRRVRHRRHATSCPKRNQVRLRR
jgi:hypothetical protein